MSLNNKKEIKNMKTMKEEILEKACITKYDVYLYSNIITECTVYLCNFKLEYLDLDNFDIINIRDKSLYSTADKLSFIMQNSIQTLLQNSITILNELHDYICFRFNNDTVDVIENNTKMTQKIISCYIDYFLKIIDEITIETSKTLKLLNERELKDKLEKTSTGEVF